MGLDAKTVVVVPCYNEATRLDGAAFVQAAEQDPNLGFVFVNDGSKDATSDVLRLLKEQCPTRIHVLELEKNGGKANAVRAGVLRAFELEPVYVGYWDADLATPLRCIDLFAHEMQRRGASLVLGARVRLMGTNIARKAARHYIGRGFATMAAFSLGFPVYDTQCGAKLFRAGPAFRAAFSKKFEMTWTFDVELLHRLSGAEAQAAGFEIQRDCVEYPLPEWVDAPGSKITLSHYPRILRELLQLTFRRVAHRR